MTAVVRRVRAGLTASLVAVLAAACATVPGRAPAPPATPLDWPQRRAQLQLADEFALKGRLAVAAGEEGFTAGLRWQQRDGAALIELDGPFGVGGLRLQLRGESIELTTARGERLDGDAARGELERRLGFRLPLQSLRFWVRGVPDPAGAAEERLAAPAARPDGAAQWPRLDGLVQDGWAVDYTAYRDDAGEGGPLPRLLSVAREGTRLRLVIENWVFGAGG